jgi:hypothetical protein
MAKPSKKSNETTLELTGKFGNLTKFLFGGRSTTKKDVFFNGKAKVVKDKDTASKIKPLQQGNDMLDMLMKIYQFMNKNFEADRLHREQQNNFKEEQQEENARRHKALLEAIQKLMKGEIVSETAEKVDETSGLFDKLLDKLSKYLEDKLYQRLLDRFAKFSLLADIMGSGVAGPLIATYAALLAPWVMTAIEMQRIKENPDAPEFKDNPFAMAYRREAKSQGAAGAINTRKVIARTAGGGGYVPTPEEAQNILDNATSESDLKAFGGKEKLQEIASQKKQVTPIPTSPEKEQSAGGGAAFVGPKTGKRKSTPVTQSPSVVPPTETKAPSAAPAAAEPSSNKLNTVTTENNNRKVEAATASPSETTVNNVNTSTTQSQRPAPQRVKVPPVRNQEPTFQSMIIYSTRVV